MERFTLEFWRGTMHIGECSLPIQSIRESKAEQVRGSANSCPMHNSHHFYSNNLACLMTIKIKLTSVWCRSGLRWRLGQGEFDRPACGLTCHKDMPKRMVRAHIALPHALAVGSMLPAVLLGSVSELSDYAYGARRWARTTTGHARLPLHELQFHRVQ